MRRQIYLYVISLCALTLAGCGTGAGASTPTKVAAHLATAAPTTADIQIATSTPPSATEPTVTPTLGIRPTPGRTVTSPAATATSPVTATAAPAEPQPARLLFVSVHPLTVAAGGSLTVALRTAGDVQRAELYLGSGAPNAPSPSTFPLGEHGSGSWSGVGLAPAVGGTYHFTVGLYNAAGRRFLEDNDAWNVQVQGGPPPGASGNGGGIKPLFADIPLAPPFSYGNPVQAVFNANGRTVNGSEVVSNTRPDVPAATVAQFYSIHFPRSGWSTSGAAVPVGATSFSMAATSGSRVCVIQFSGGTVHIFYG